VNLLALLLLLAAPALFAGEALLTCTPPTLRTNGTDLAGELESIRFYWGCSSSGSYTDSLTLPPSSCTGTTIAPLPDVNSCYFAATAIDTAGLESQFSNEAAKVMGPPGPPGSGLPGVPIFSVSWLESPPPPAYEVVVCTLPVAGNFISCPNLSGNWAYKAQPAPADLVWWATTFTGAYQPPGPTLNNAMSGPGLMSYVGWRQWQNIPSGTRWIMVRIAGQLWYIEKE